MTLVNDMRPKQPCSLDWVSMSGNARLMIDTSWHIRLYVGSVSVCCWLNLSRKPSSPYSEAFNWDKHCQVWLVNVPTTVTNRMRDVEVSVRSVIVSATISCDWWPDSHQEHNTLKPHCMNTITNCVAWRLSLCTCAISITWPRQHYDEEYCHGVEVWVYQPRELTTQRSHSSCNGKTTRKPRSADKIQNTKHDLKILLKHQSTTPSPLLHYNITVTVPYMPGSRLTPSECTHRKKVESFSDLIFY